MTRKRKKDNISPLNDNKESKRKMAANTQQNFQSPNLQQAASPAQVGQYGIGQSFMLPPLYHPSSPFVTNQTSPILSQQNVNNLNTDILQGIIQRLDSMDAKLGQLNKIQSTVEKITERLNSLDQKFNEIERSHAFISEQYDSVTARSIENKGDISQLRSDVKFLTAENEKLKSANDSCNENIIDLKCRSMRDNLLFFGVAEGTTFNPAPLGGVQSTVTDSTGFTDNTSTNQTSTISTSDDFHEPAGHGSISAPALFSSVVKSDHENCVDKVFTFCDKILRINDPRSKINIIRAHRVGKFISGKTRPIVAKFDSESKSLIKESLKHVKLQHTDYNVADQYPPEVKDRRKQLIPVMIDARKQGKRAVLVRDKLYIDNELYGSK
jgi:hypothetical protein